VVQVRGKEISKAGREQPDQEGCRGVKGIEEAQARGEGIGGGSKDVPTARWILPPPSNAVLLSM
jgi:hypothetical protein